MDDSTHPATNGAVLPVVLVVDDVPTNVRLLADALRDEYRIKIATDGEEALAIVDRSPPDLILLDIMMPGLDGYDVLRRLKANSRTSHIPVIFVTARDDETDEEVGLNRGAVDYITKPYSLAIVRARVRNHIRLKQQADRLESLSHIDALTEIPNRRMFDTRFDDEWRRALRENMPVALLMMDIDHFKGFNDTYGHGSGDRCLRGVAQALARGIMRPGDLVARYGGEEFVALLPDTTAEAARFVAERLRQGVLALEIPHAASSVARIVTVSVGCASVGDCAGKQPAQLLEAADAALYRAKAAGRNQVCEAFL